MFIALWHGPMSMNHRLSILVCLTLLASIVALPSNAFAEEDEIIVESNMTWSDDMTLSKDVRVQNGGSLTLSGIEVSISNGVGIFVDSNSSLNFVGSNLVGETPQGDDSPGFNINIAGKLESSQSYINDGGISASGSLFFNDTSLVRSGPVILTSGGAAISLGGDSSFTDSSGDHDIRARVQSTIIWGEDVSGSGGEVNKWERRLADQSIVFDVRYVTYEISGMRDFPTYSGLSNDDGISFIDGGRERVVEIAWSDDSVEDSSIWSEQASVTITDYRTAWNREDSGIGNYGGGPFELGWDSVVVVDDGTPMVGWVSLTPVNDEDMPLSNALVGDSVNVKAVIENSGTAAAQLYINCDSSDTGTTAQISPSYPGTTVGPISESTIEFIWRVSDAGNSSLSCRILTPTQLVDETAFGGGNQTSATVDWKVPVDEGGISLLIPAAIAITLGIVVAGYVISSRLESGEN